METFQDLDGMSDPLDAMFSDYLCQETMDEFEDYLNTSKDKEETINLVCQGGISVETPKSLICYMKTLSYMSEGLGEQNHIDVPNVSENAMRKVTLFATMLKMNGGVIGDWTQAFLESTMKSVSDIEITVAAEYLEFLELQDACTTRIAKQIETMNPAQIRQLFHFEDDLTPDQIKQIDQETSWCTSWIPKE